MSNSILHNIYLENRILKKYLVLVGNMFKIEYFELSD